MSRAAQPCQNSKSTPGTANASNYNSKNDLHMSFRKNWVDVHRSPYSRSRLAFDVTGSTTLSKILRVPWELQIPVIIILKMRTEKFNQAFQQSGFKLCNRLPDFVMMSYSVNRIMSRKEEKRTCEVNRMGKNSSIILPKLILNLSG